MNMKTTLYWVFRHLVLPVGFIWSTGFFALAVWVLNDRIHAIDPYMMFTDEEYATLELHPHNFFQYSDSILLTREDLAEKTGRYDPYLYFFDYKQFQMFEAKYYDTLTADPKMRMYLLALNTRKSHLAAIRDPIWKYTQDEIIEARWYWFPCAADEERKPDPPIFWWPQVIVPVFLWFLSLYLKGMPFALFQFIVWKRTFSEEQTYDMEQSWNVWRRGLNGNVASLSLIVSLLIWPIILWIDVRSRIKAHLAESEIMSRRSTMLSLLSKQEKQLLELGKRMTLKEFREHLDAMGMTRKHSYAKAFVVTLCVVVVPRGFLIAQPVSDDVGTETVITNTDYGGSDHSSLHTDTDDGVIAFVVDVWKEWIIPAVDIFCFPRDTFDVLYGFLRDIGVVPEGTNQNQLELICLLKGIKNEKYSSNYCF